MDKIKLDYVALMCKKNIDATKINGLEIKKYIPIEKKMEYIDNFCMSIVHTDNGEFRYNSVERFIKGILFILSIYTNIEIEGTYAEFDIISQNNVIESVIPKIEEYQEFKQFLDARFQDYLNGVN